MLQDVELACKEPTLIGALSFIAVEQAKKFFESGIVDDKSWNTCFKVYFESVINEWNKNKDLFVFENKIYDLQNDYLIN